MKILGFEVEQIDTLKGQRLSREEFERLLAIDMIEVTFPKLNNDCDIAYKGCYKKQERRDVHIPRVVSREIRDVRLKIELENLHEEAIEEDRRRKG